MIHEFLKHPLSHRWHFGLLAVAVSLLISYGIWIGSMAYYDDWYDDPWKYPAKVGSHGSLLLMCWSFLLSTRFGLIERMFGGLDKVYHAHRYIGEAAFLLIFLHPVFLAMHRIEEGIVAYGGYFAEWSDPVRMTGLAALAGFIILVVLSIYWKIAYHKWKQTHNLFGALLVLILIHAVWAQGEIMRYPALRFWFAAWCTLALGSYVYIRIFYRHAGPQFDCRISKVRDAGDGVTELYFEPVGRRMVHEPGQFIYVSLDAMAVSQEPHPFTISSIPEAKEIRLSIKALGDWTEDIQDVRAGDPARIWGPYGHFFTALWDEPEKRAVFLGGGIGITPFLGILGSGALAKRPGPVRLVYSVTSKETAIYAEELQESMNTVSAGKLFAHYSDDEGFLDADWLQEKLGELTNTEYFLCGPGPMVDSLQKVLLEAGLNASEIHVEKFEIR